MSARFDWRLMMRLALRDLRGGLRGFSVFVICVALGVAVIAAVGLVSDSLTAGFSAEGRQMLGGDLAVSRVHGRAKPGERQDLEALGGISEVATLRGMVQKADAATGARVMVEIKAVDQAYPLAGTFTGAALSDARDALRTGRTMLVAPILLERLGAKVGDRLRLGAIDVVIADVIAKEPDGLTARAAFGPRVMVSLETLGATELVGPGSLVRWRYRVALSEKADKNSFAASVENVKSTFVPRGFTVRDRRDPAPGITAGIDRFRQFLTLVGLTAMLVGGVGVANAVRAYLNSKRGVIASYKCLGASGDFVVQVRDSS